MKDRPQSTPMMHVLFDGGCPLRRNDFVSVLSLSLSLSLSLLPSLLTWHSALSNQA